MKRKTVLGCLVILALCIAPHAGLAAYAPHNASYNISCTSCHDLDGLMGLVDPATLNAAFLKNCQVCHNNDTGANYDKNNAPFVKTHSSEYLGTKYGNWHKDCWDCHGHGRPETALVDGSFSNPVYDPVTEMTTVAVNSYTVVNADWTDPNRWASKTGNERGLIFSFVYFDTDAGKDSTASFEVKGVTTDGAGAVTDLTVRGNLTQALSADFMLSYGQMIKPKVNGATVNFVDAHTLAVDESGTGTDATPNGICQVCHTQTTHWRSDGTLADHFNGEACTACHAHVKGFQPSCDVCHGEPPTSLATLVFKPAPTGSQTAGQHALHATASGYNFPCETCHVDGMPATPILGNNKIQVGFDTFGIVNPDYATSYGGQAGVSYEGTNGNTVSANGSMVCSNVYCHSAGKQLAVGYDVPSQSPAWDGSSPDKQGDGFACNNCHTYPPLFDKHQFHFNWGVNDCSICHYGTTTDGTTIADKSLHVNGQYDVIPSGVYYNYNGEPIQFTFTYTYAPNGGTCSGNTCHEQVHIATTQVWENRDLYIGASLAATPTIDSGTGQPICGSMDFAVNVVETQDTIAPFTCDMDLNNDGTADTAGACTATYDYTQGGTVPIGWDTLVNVSWTVHDVNGSTIAPPNPRSQQVVVCPSPNIPPTVQYTVAPLNDGKFGGRLSDTSFDPDFDLYGRSGPGTIRIDWGDGTVAEYPLDMTATAPPAGSEHLFTHSYVSGGTFYVKAWVKDNAVAGQWVVGPTLRLRITY